MNYTSIYYDTIPHTIEYGIEVTWTGIKWLLQLIIMLIIASLRAETPHTSRILFTLLTMLYYMVESGRNMSIWGWQHIRRVLRHEANYWRGNYEYRDDIDDTMSDYLQDVTLPSYFSNTHYKLLKETDKDLDCQICYRTMNEQDFRIFRRCCHICCSNCIEKLVSRQCPYCKTVL
jgi:hypothetical protein